MDSDSCDQITSRFRYNPNANTQFSGMLEIFIHHARNIHNICIYENQDVYAKFSLTYNPDETFSTRIIHGGGKNPEFNEKLGMKITQFDALLKCEMWMLSRVKNYMEDQLLGFSLVPISLVVGKGELTQEFSLSSTDLFHSPAGTVKLSLSLHPNLPFNPFLGSPSSNSSISSEVVLLDRKISEVALDPIEYSRIEFPDIHVASENQQMVSEYFGFIGPGPFLCLGASDDTEMTANSSEDNGGDNSGFLSSTMTSLSDEKNSADSLEKKNNLAGEPSNSPKASSANKNEAKEESVMQKEIVDMYVRSMQQFTESLAKMKLPMNLDKTETQEQDRGDVIQRPKNKNNVEKKDGSRVFYGSRAFF